jgi:hypothetical protein
MLVRCRSLPAGAVQAGPVNAQADGNVRAPTKRSCARTAMAVDFTWVWAGLGYFSVL